MVRSKNALLLAGTLRDLLMEVNRSNAKAGDFLDEVSETRETGDQRFKRDSLSRPVNDSELAEIKGAWTEYGLSLSGAIPFDASRSG